MSVSGRAPLSLLQLDQVERQDLPHRGRERRRTADPDDVGLHPDVGHRTHAPVVLEPGQEGRAHVSLVQWPQRRVDAQLEVGDPARVLDLEQLIVAGLPAKACGQDVLEDGALWSRRRSCPLP